MHLISLLKSNRMLLKVSSLLLLRIPQRYLLWWEMNEIRVSLSIGLPYAYNLINFYSIGDYSHANKGTLSDWCHTCPTTVCSGIPRYVDYIFTHNTHIEGQLRWDHFSVTVELSVKVLWCCNKHHLEITEMGRQENYRWNL